MNLWRNDLMPEICFNNYFSQKRSNDIGKRLINFEAR